jgi:hypothetical protein
MVNSSEKKETFHHSIMNHMRAAILVWAVKEKEFKITQGEQTSSFLPSRRR